VLVVIESTTRERRREGINKRVGMDGGGDAGTVSKRREEEDDENDG
jgi:hypothetical protein